ncbi:ApeA N-terminal domain 1-containing protein [Tsukamurella paurometabola]|uniref:ApeA N-terminal domain-containing protein n=1 Tax=Tsukamurella paurometabola TaxID=2061 RepID=A0ABS5NFI4_TSUPA|nr:HEPN domain-containing protein [Tsukamurella paurometabola]MBS4102790.1 hypothetical protein [Tsukamurella paurometabola]
MSDDSSDGTAEFVATGKFWVVGDDTRQVPGTITWRSAEDARIVLSQRLVEELAQPIKVTETGGISMVSSGKPSLVVADGLARLFLGDTDEGPVTCLDSYLRHPARNLFDVGAMFEQVWDPYTLIVGAHLTDGHRSQLDSVRFTLDHPAWWSHLTDGDSATSDAGTVVCELTPEGTVWLEYRPTSTMTLREASEALHSVETLLKLAVGVDLTPSRLQIRSTGSRDWLEVKTATIATGTVAYPSPRDLLPPTSITLERLARWMTIQQTMDGLAAAVADPVQGPIQVQALVACSLVEGVHKRLIGGDIEFPPRAQALYDMARTVDSKITSPVQNWPNLIKEVRNDLAHHNPVDAFDLQFLEWVIAEATARWVLRVCLLLHARFGNDELSQALSEHQRYQFYRENLKVHVKELKALKYQRKQE